MIMVVMMAVMMVLTLSTMVIPHANPGTHVR